jgi:choline dehydrogenase-like flavoprotein
MLIDARGLRGGEQFDADVCIIGAGAAGIAIAREWVGIRQSVVLLESGGFAPDAETQALYSGEATGNVLANSDTYLSRSRLRYFGGSTNHWGGICRPMDPLDLETRPWVADSGWPFARSELEPFYRRAIRLVQVPGFGYDIESEHPRNRPPLALGRGEALETAVVHFSPPTRFGQRYRDDVVSAENISLHLYANALELQTSPDGERIEAVRVGCLAGPRYRVRARVFVLATGGIENARLLLASNRKRTSGLGNERDLVGRFFMDHVSMRGARAGFTLPFSAMRLYRPGNDGARAARSLGLFTLREAVQREHALLAMTVRLLRVPWADVGAAERAVVSGARAIDALDRSAPPACDSLESDAFVADFQVIAEPSPQRDSRVTLGSDRDALGLPIARVDWRVAAGDYSSIARSLELMAIEFGRHARGRVRPNVGMSAGRLFPLTDGFSHHMGTTRMHDDAARGVVDPSCRVHSLANLFVAGSSVFPTAGAEGTTTLTLLALALRLADHLKRELTA